MTQENDRKNKIAKIILGYSFALIFIALAANLLVFGVNPISIALPSLSIFSVLVISALSLLANHTWLMTSTELTRLRYNMHATPEEWEASKHRRDDVSDEGLLELERRQNAHRNATENTVFFVLLAILVSVASPVTFAAEVWIVGFAIGRLAHTYFYLSGSDGARGISMSFSLVSLYGLASYLAVSLIV